MGKRQRDRKKYTYSDAKEKADKHDSGFTATYLDLPEGCKEFKFDREGIFRIDLIPFVAKKGNPYADEGTLHFERTYFYHKNVGPENRNYVCPRKTYGKKCPICEYTARLRTNPKADTKKIMEKEAKERQLFNFRDVSSPESADLGIQLYEASFYKGFGQILDNKLKKNEEYRSFHHLEGGLTLKVTVVGDTFKGKEFFKPVAITFVPRKEDYTDEILEEAYSLDDIPKEVSYKDLLNVFEYTSGSKPSASTKTKPVDEDEEDDNDEEEEEKEEEEDDDDEDSEGDDDEEDEEEEDEDEEEEETAEDLGIAVGAIVKHKKHGRCTVKHVAADGGSLRLEDSDGEIHRAIPPSECKLVKAAKKSKPKDDDDDDDDSDDDTPKRGKKGKKGKKVKDDEDEEEDDEEEDEDEDETPFDDDEEDEDEDDEEGDEEDEEEEDEEEGETPKKRGKKK